MRLKPLSLEPEGVVSRTLSFEDNARCAVLFGRHHEHLALLEQHLPVTLAARGNLVTISGEPEPADAAAAVLEELYRQLDGGMDLGRSEVDAAIRMIVRGPRDGTTLTGDDVVIRTERRRVSPRSPTQAAYLRATYLAVATGVALLRQRVVDRLILSRPAVEAGERLGFLPGDMKDKVDPYLRPLYDALQDMLPDGKLGAKLESGQIEIAPLAFMRGRTLANAFVILDEAQNTTPAQMKMFLTRLGENSRMVVTGDPSQDDLPPGTRSGLVDAVDRLDQTSEVAVIRFSEQDIVRHPLVEVILQAYSREGAPQAQADVERPCAPTR
jgi:phosphate starvation-inducible PhoH-like protein